MHPFSQEIAYPFNSRISALEFSDLPDEKDALEINSLEITHSDAYYLDLSIHSETPVRFSIFNDKDEAIYSLSTADLDEKKIK